ncbi:MAG: autotransporter domain-containing protein [Polyangiaceae bacterium]
MKKQMAFAVAFPILALGLLGSQSAMAEVRTHDGFFLQLDAGLGYLSSTASANGVENTYSGMTYATAIFLGGTIGPVAIGGGMTYDNAFSPKSDQGSLSDVSLHLIGFGPYVDVYPNPTSGLHFVGFAGWGGLEASYKGNVGGSDPTGLVAFLGGGYEFWVADQWSIGPLARLSYAPLSLNGVDFNTTAFTVVADFKYH